MLDPHGALIYTMVIVSAAESELPDSELQMIGDIIGRLPVFRGFDRQALPKLLNGCTEALAREDGLEETLQEINKALPAKLHETTYAIACAPPAPDAQAHQQEF